MPQNANIFRSLALRLSLAALTLAAAGCSFTPEYTRPQIAETSGGWPGGEGEPQTDASGNATSAASATADIGWREFFTDHRMQLLIEKSLHNNRDLRIAALNAEAAAAQYRIRRADIAPQLDGQADGSLQNLPPDVAPGDNPRETTEVYSVGLGVASWEVDLWGRLRNLRDESLQSYLAVEETRTAIQISLIAQTINAYLVWLSDLERLRITQETLQSLRESLDIQVRSLEGGVGTELDVAQARSSVHQTEVDLARIERQLAQDFNLLALLVGEPINEETKNTLAEGRELLYQPAALPDVPAGLPSDLLARRPDIRAAEHRLIGAHANIGAARAAFFPTVTLTGAVGTTSDGLSGLFADGSGFWRFTPQVRLPIFDAGSNQANLDLAEVRRNINVAEYERTIQVAFREVADALAGRAQLLRELEAQRQLVESSQRSFDLYRIRFEQGRDSYFNSLIWQRLLFDAQQDLVGVQLQQLANRVNLYKAVGGGWR